MCGKNAEAPRPVGEVRQVETRQADPMSQGQALNSPVNRILSGELNERIGSLRQFIGRLWTNCNGVEHDALVEAQKRLSECEMWAKRAIRM